MRCLFCKQSSDGSKSVEHIIPESLGNVQHVLPKGVVCDKCNNYFSRKVEGPFLNSGAVRMMRCEQGVPNKDGRLVGLPGLLMNQFPVTAYMPYQEMRVLDVESSEGLRALLSSGKGVLRFPVDYSPPNDRIVSRFLAKAAIEALASTALRASLSLDELIDHAQLDALRSHARVGDPRIKWPYSIRRIYDMDRAWKDQNEAYQLVHEFDFLLTDGGEWYFVLIIFGLEMAINLGGPEVEGYHRWLSIHADISPLYYGKNAHPMDVPASSI
jgi:hypothetical protein